jgi:L,D-transpeptidase YcbB
VAARLETLRANLPRVQEHAVDLGQRYVVVNIPGAQLEAVEFGRVRSRHNVVVGMPDRPSPAVSSRIHELNFNPYWHAPVSIVRKDIIPKYLENPNLLDQLGIRVFDGWNGPEIDPRTVDWRTVAPDRYQFRQDPGDENAMASVKINFPNKHSVYMHDTPTKELFTEASRYFSSGCVRVEQVHELTNWILNGQEGWDPYRIQSVVRAASGSTSQSPIRRKCAGPISRRGSAATASSISATTSTASTAPASSPASPSWRPGRRRGRRLLARVIPASDR